MGVRTARVSRVGPAEGKAPPSDQRSPILISVFQNLISQASFAPSVGFANVFLEDNPHVNTYMWNVIGALPLTRALLSGLEFWRTDVGVAFRW